jgi:hypothetical protein
MWSIDGNGSAGTELFSDILPYRYVQLYSFMIILANLTLETSYLDGLFRWSSSLTGRVSQKLHNIVQVPLQVQGSSR